ncbi:LysR family transcriptional regulator [Pseudaminobacter soli (ex Li et al. 2025)]|uniref:LysR family transcriptional regulator n=1 Tax=Pseudaminobacter soli (ex Li et al. 2025) TaxID=1295366 RepID=A0A2P7SJY1_9HYPH|nr:LysR family transcriptional regulator [Mesorhizobium soli]PSJ62796.1 LysR family transcriptional regulator [Mesorhizobium soli]
MDRLDAMQVLLAVVDAGSLSAASRKLNAPLPSVSRKVAELERHLGTRLLVRTSRNVQLTDAGRDYVDAARQIIAQIEDAELRASGEYHTPRGVLTITVPITFGQDYVLPFAYDFLREHPEITLNVISLDRVVNLVDEHVDVGVRLGELADSSFYAVKVGDFDFVTCASPEYLARKGRPSSPEELVNHDGAVFGQITEPGWIYQQDSLRLEAKPNIRVRANTATATVTAATRGVGIIRIPRYQVAKELRSGALVAILDDYGSPSFPAHLVYVRQGLLPLKVRVFIDWMAPRLKRALNDLAAFKPERDQPNG